MCQKGKLEAKDYTTGIISQLTVRRTHMRKVIPTDAEFTIELIQHRGKQESQEVEPAEKQRTSEKLEFYELVTRE